MTDQPYDPYSTPSSRPPEPPIRSAYNSQPFVSGQQNFVPQTQPIAAPSETGQFTQPIQDSVAEQPTEQQPAVQNPTEAMQGDLDTVDTSGIDVTGEMPGAAFAPHGNGFDQAARSGDTQTMPPAAAAAPAFAARPQHQAPAQAVYADAASKKKSGGGKSFLFGFLGALLACVLAFSVAGFGFGAFGNSRVPGSSQPSTSNQLGSATPSVINAAEEGQSLSEAVAAKALPSVVCIYVYQQANYGNYFGFAPSASDSESDELTQSSLGSGVILSEDGYILTNYHVIENSDALKVNIAGTEYDAEVVGGDQSSDLAVIKVKDASGLVAADIGDSDNLTVGEWVMTVGAPFGLEQSVATGVVSATNRSRVVEDTSGDYSYYFGMTQSNPTLYPNMIQTDAAINPGNSGGALVDADGKVIGINTLTASYAGDSAGVGFAIPINYAISIADQIIDGKTPTHAKLGVSLVNVTSQVASRYNLPVEYGAYVSDVSVGSGAAEAGVEVGDIIIAMNGQKITTSTDLTLAIRGEAPGDEITLTVNRGGEEKELKVTLGSDEADLAAQNAQPEQGQLGQGDEGEGRGYSYEDLLKLFGGE